MSNNDTITDYRYGDGQPDGATVREILVSAYGDDWESHLSHVVDVAERSEMHYRTDTSGFKSFHHDYFPVIVLQNTKSKDVFGYEDPIGVANYRVLRDQWSDVEGLSDGPWSGSSHIALDLDSESPADLVDVLESLSDYPVLSDDEHSLVEQEMIQEHWESYGLHDSLDTVAKAIGADSRLDLTDYATELVTELTFSGALDYGYGDGWPTMIDVSACDFGSEAVAQWIRARLGLVVSVRRNSGYGPSFTAYLNKGNLLAS